MHLEKGYCKTVAGQKSKGCNCYKIILLTEICKKEILTFYRKEILKREPCS